MNNPQFIAIDGAGNVYVTDSSGVRMINDNGIIDTILGFQRCNPGPLASDRMGRVFVRCFDGQIMRIDGKNSATVVGRMSPHFGFSGDGGPASADAPILLISEVDISIGVDRHPSDKPSHRLHPRHCKLTNGIAESNGCTCFVPDRGV